MLLRYVRFRAQTHLLPCVWGIPGVEGGVFPPVPLVGDGRMLGEVGLGSVDVGVAAWDVSCMSGFPTSIVVVVLKAPLSYEWWGALWRVFLVTIANGDDQISIQIWSLAICVGSPDMVGSVARVPRGDGVCLSFFEGRRPPLIPASDDYVCPSHFHVTNSASLFFLLADRDDTPRFRAKGQRVLSGNNLLELLRHSLVIYSRWDVCSWADWWCLMVV